jgi:hypothetical protein
MSEAREAYPGADEEWWAESIADRLAWASRYDTEMRAWYLYLAELENDRETPPTSPTLRPVG